MSQVGLFFAGLKIIIITNFRFLHRLGDRSGSSATRTSASYFVVCVLRHIPPGVYYKQVIRASNYYDLASSGMNKITMSCNNACGFGKDETTTARKQIDTVAGNIDHHHRVPSIYLLRRARI